MRLALAVGQCQAAPDFHRLGQGNESKTWCGPGPTASWRQVCRIFRETDSRGVNRQSGDEMKERGQKGTEMRKKLWSNSGAPGNTRSTLCYLRFWRRQASAGPGLQRLSRGPEGPEAGQFA